LTTLLKAHQVVQRVVERAQVRVHLLAQVAGQKAQLLAGFHRRARQHNPLHRAALQRVHGHRHRQVGLAGAGRANAEGDVVVGNVVQVHALHRSAGLQVGPARLQGHGAVRAFSQGAVAGQRELHRVGRDRPRRNFIERLQHFECALGFGLGAVDLELLVPVGDGHAQRQLDLAQVGVGRAAQVGQAGVVGRREVVAKDHGVRWEQPGIVAAQGREGPIR
jgi:hypothetical protein